MPEKNWKILMTISKTRQPRRHVTDEEYRLMFYSQKGKCAICGTNQHDLERKLSVDHDHQTGEIRGLLCDRCNLGIGYFYDNPDLLSNAIEYIRKNRTGMILRDEAVKAESKSSITYNFIKEFVRLAGRMPTITEVQNNIGFSRGLVSRVGNEFIVKNSETLLENGIVNQERVAAAFKSVG